MFASYRTIGESKLFLFSSFEIFSERNHFSWALDTLRNAVRDLRKGLRFFFNFIWRMSTQFLFCHYLFLLFFSCCVIRHTYLALPVETLRFPATQLHWAVTICFSTSFVVYLALGHKTPNMCVTTKGGCIHWRPVPVPLSWHLRDLYNSDFPFNKDIYVICTTAPFQSTALVETLCSLKRIFLKFWNADLCVMLSMFLC